MPQQRRRKCELDGNPLPPKTGRPAHYCSDTERVAAQRLRDLLPSVDDLDKALGEAFSDRADRARYLRRVFESRLHGAYVREDPNQQRQSPIDLRKWRGSKAETLVEQVASSVADERATSGASSGSRGTAATHPHG